MTLQVDGAKVLRTAAYMPARPMAMAAGLFENETHHDILRLSVRGGLRCV
jgi:hypothetical protein